MQKIHIIFVAFLVTTSILLIFLTLSIAKEKFFFAQSLRTNEYIKEDLENSKLRLRIQDEEIISKLSPYYKSIEEVTHPLPLSPKCSKDIFLILLVVTSPDGYIRRNAIRGTWAQSFKKIKHKSKSDFKTGEDYLVENVVKTVFLIGHSLDKKTMDLVETEAKVFGDIVLGGFHENYRNLTMKTRLGLMWAYFHCQAKYILKTDDDVFVNPFPLVEWLKEQPRSKFYSGWCNFGSQAVRDPNNKWYVSVEDFPGSTYPGYCLGGGYVMSDDVLGRIIKLSYGKKIFPMEDLYVGLLVKSLGDVEPKDNKEGFDLVFGGAKGCRYNSLYLAHPVNPDNQLKMLLEANNALISC